MPNHLIHLVEVTVYDISGLFGNACGSVVLNNGLDVTFDTTMVIHHFLEGQREASQQRNGVIDL